MSCKCINEPCTCIKCTECENFYLDEESVLEEILIDELLYKDICTDCVIELKDKIEAE